VTYTPLVINLTLNQKGILPCYFAASPPHQFISWTKDRRIFDPFDEAGIQVLRNGSLLIEKTPASHINWDYRATLLIAGSTASGENIGEFECLINDDVFSKTLIRRINTTVINSDLFNVEVEIETDNTRQHVLRYRKHGDEWDNLPITPLTLKLHSTLYTGKIQIPGLSRHESYELQVFSEQKVEAWHPEDNTPMISAATTVGGGVTVSVAIMIIFTFSLIYHS